MKNYWTKIKKYSERIGWLLVIISFLYGIFSYAKNLEIYGKNLEELKQTVEKNTEFNSAEHRIVFITLAEIKQEQKGTKDFLEKHINSKTVLKGETNEFTIIKASSN